MKNINRKNSLVGLLIIAFFMFIVTSLSGQFGGGQGTEQDPWQIATADHLDNIRYHLENHFIQTADIDLGVPPWNENEGWPLE